MVVVRQLVVVAWRPQKYELQGHGEERKGEVEKKKAAGTGMSMSFSYVVMLA